MTAFLWIAAGIIASYGFGFLTRWIADFRLRRQEKAKLEAEYKLKLKEEIERIKQEYDSKINELKKLAPSDVLIRLSELTK